ncbi:MULTISPECIES: hypothetical protein [Halomicrobium]|uniref:Uncharacterized protein n=2 Tax=Halomicrobium mukohataei TaxID=57705 RepID=C7P4B8_HALMD|nr:MULTISPECIES: hypothetical protein [Halomicrobium]ACV47940.1 hypothetical protein Hmuk_1826 [Halomicrobium mukohataei DSM 12286]QCD66377.1 hypothetical protein E5139_12250 [Halomicrobium mukohataei]QFR21182.1 hypothetical protein GBQ70_12260 [Halomicrobium sp. ZPS1]
MLTRQLYLLGGGLALLGSLTILANLVIAGMWDNFLVINALVVVFVCVVGLRKIYEREDFERDHALPYRVLNLGIAIGTVIMGIVMLGIGSLTYQWLVVGGSP